jgi:hypothetical protein
LNPNLVSANILLGLLGTVQHECGEAEGKRTGTNYSALVAKALLSYASACRGDQNQALRYLKDAAASKGPGYVSPYQLALVTRCCMTKTQRFPIWKNRLTFTKDKFYI